MGISKDLQKINKDECLMSYDFNSFYSSAQIDINSIWPEIDTAYPLKNIWYMSEAVSSLFNSGRWNELNRSAFLAVKYHNPENLVFQHFPAREKIKNPYKNKRFGENNRTRNDIILDTLTGVDFVEIVKCGAIILEVYDGCFRLNQEYNPYTEKVTDMF